MGIEYYIGFRIDNDGPALRFEATFNSAERAFAFATREALAHQDRIKEDELRFFANNGTAIIGIPYWDIVNALEDRDPTHDDYMKNCGKALEKLVLARMPRPK